MGWIESQIEARMAYDTELNERAYAELAAGLTSPKNAPRLSFDETEQMDGAARLCLRYCHVEPGEVPENVVDLNERLDYLCRPSGTMRRKVRLDEGWYKRAFGALLGRLDTGESVALLPRGAKGYQYYDPSTGKKTKVTPGVAQHIEPEAVFFYRPLPLKPLTVKDLTSFIFSVFSKSDYALVIAAALAATLVGLLPAWANSVAFGVVVPSGRASLILPVAALAAPDTASRKPSPAFPTVSYAPSITGWSPRAHSSAPLANPAAASAPAATALSTTGFAFEKASLAVSAAFPANSSMDAMSFLLFSN